MVKAYFSLADIAEYMKKREIKKHRNKTRASLHDFVVRNINRKFYASIARSVDLQESREFKSSMTATLFIQNLKTVRALRVSSCVIPNNMNKSIKTKDKGGQKENTFVQMPAYICGMNKLKWPRCLSLLKKILNLEEVFKKICKRNL